MALETEIESLNDAQKDAVLHLGSPLLILAGPGSGKTRTITIKIAWLIEELKIRPNSVLAMTFTNKAAREMKERIHGFINISRNTEQDQIYRGPFISTFHSCGSYLLRRYFTHAKVHRNFQIYDTTEQLTLLHQANPQLPKNKLRGVLHAISRAKDYAISAQADENILEEYFENPQVYKNYEDLKMQTGNVDFGDLLLKPYQIFSTNQEIKKEITRMWNWFFIDEYQDTNYMQNLWLRTLCSHTGNIVVVGDDDQSIYQFRGAIVENILKFEHEFKNTKIIYLNQNYRSSPQIISFANQLIEYNSSRYKKNIFSANSEGLKPSIQVFEYDDDEEAFIVEQAKQAIKENKHLAVFYRVNAQSRGYEMALRKAQIGYRLVGSLEFFERIEIKDAIALLRLFKNANDIVSFLRIANKPTRGLGASTLAKISELMKKGLTWLDAYAQVKGTLTRKSLEGFEELLVYLTNNNENKEDATKEVTLKSIGTILRLLLEQSKLWAYYTKEEDENNTDRLSNLEELISYTMDFQDTTEGWNTFFEQVALNEDRTIEEKQNSLIHLITLHRSKGLEFDKVIICGLEEDLIPMIRDDETGYQSALEEERRLLYVGITRAKHAVALTCCRNRKRYGRLEYTIFSQFLECFDESTVTVIENSNKTTKSKTNKEIWNIGDRVTHKEYGYGYVRRTSVSKKHTVVHVEFDNEYEAMFIPKFTQELMKVKE